MKKRQSTIGKAIEKELKSQLREMNSKDENGKARHGLVDRCRVLDRALKWEAIQAKLGDAGFGGAFSDPDDSTEPEPNDESEEE